MVANEICRMQAGKQLIVHIAGASWQLPGELRQTSLKKDTGSVLTISSPQEGSTPPSFTRHPCQKETIACPDEARLKPSVMMISLTFI